MKRAHWEAWAAVLIFGSVPVTIKGVAADPWVIGLVRLGIATTCVLLFLRGSGELRRSSRRDLGRLALIGLTFGLHWLTYFWSIKWANASLAAIGMATFGVQVSLLGVVMLGQRPTARQLAALAVSVLGTVLVIEEFSLANATTAGFLLAMFSGTLYALLPIWHQKFAAVPVNIRTLGQYLFALPLFLPFLPRADWNLTTGDWLGLLHLAVLGTFVAHSLWIRATSVLPAATSGLIYYLYVPLALFYSWLFLGEAMPPMKLAGAALIVVASWMGLARAREPAR